MVVSSRHGREQKLRFKEDGMRIFGVVVCVLFGLVLLSLAGYKMLQEVNAYKVQVNLKENGRETVGRVSHVRTFRKSGKQIREYYSHTISYAGHELKRNLNPPLAVGTELPVLFLPEAPKQVIIGGVSDQMADLRGDRKQLLTQLILGASLWVLLGFFGAACFYTAALLRRRESKPA